MLEFLLLLLNALLKAEEDAGGAADDEDHGDDDEGGNQDQDEQTVVLLSGVQTEKKYMRKLETRKFNTVHMYIILCILDRRFPLLVIPFTASFHP